MKALLLAVALLSSNVYATTIDLFDHDQGPLVATVGETIFNSVSGTGILGGYRDVVVSNYSGLNAGSSATLQVDYSNLTFSADSTVEASFWIQWDGNDNSASVNTTGLMDSFGNGKDLTGSSFETETLFADENYLFDIEVWWDQGTKSEKVTLLGPGTEDYNNPLLAHLSCSVFDFADLTDVTALVVGGNVSAPADYLNLIGGSDDIVEGTVVPAFDVTIGSIQTVQVPEPATAAMFLLGIAGLAASRKVV